MTEPPIIKGGQGRTSHDVMAAAEGIVNVIVFCAVVALLCILFLSRGDG